MKKFFTLFLASFLIFDSAKTQSLLDSGLVAYYPFNGNDSDYSIFSNHPNFNNASLTTDRFGNQNSAYKFNGQNQYLRIPNSSTLNAGTKISLCAWIKVSGFYYGLCHGNIIMQKGNSDNVSGFYTLRFSDSNSCSGLAPDTLRQRFYGRTSGVSPTNFIQKDIWYFIVSTYDGNYGKLYINGKLENTIYAPGIVASCLDDLFIGKMNNSQYSYWLNGSLDDIRIYNRPLNLNEVRTLYKEEPKTTVSGNIYVDNNNDGIKDSLDYDMSYTKVKLSNGDIAFTDYDGSYSLFIDSVGKYVVSIDSTPIYIPTPSNDTLDITKLDTSITRDFRMLLNTGSLDSISVKITPLINAARPGFVYPIVVNYVNTGNSIINVSNNFTFDTTILQYDSSSSIGVVKNWNILSTTSNQMYPGQRNVFIAYFTVKSTAHLGDSVKLYATATANNAASFDTIYARIRGSYDPNEKDATPLLTTADVANGKFIDYIIRFENTGTDTAFKVLITDELSTLLDLSTIQITGLSHPCNILVNENKVTFTFNKIYLPYTGINNIASHGYIAFKVKPKNTVVDGTDIPNKASIYFDYNLPIVTNTAVTKIRNPIITPLKITDYTATQTNDINVKNTWFTSNEVNVDHFNVQRSFNGVDYANVGEIAAKNKNSNTYTFIDELKNIGVKNIYYRIMSVDKDGKTSFSATKQIVLKQNKSLVTIFPNPSNQKINISRVNAGVENLTITDVNGKVISRLQIVGLHATIDVSNLANGIYVIQFANGENIKFVKQ